MKAHIRSKVSHLFCNCFIIVLLTCLPTHWIQAQSCEIPPDKILAESGFQGGLVVLVGHFDAECAISLGKASNIIVHWLMPDGPGLGDARNKIRTEGIYGRTSVMAWESGQLPYTDNMVNLLVLEDNMSPGIENHEMMRVLAPLGVAVQLSGSGQMDLCIRKPHPNDVDEWTHSRRDATGNAVSRDRRVGPPRYMQWEALPRWNHGTKTSALVLAQGRIFYILDDSHFASDTRTWSLIARDAYNGILLWRHQLPSWGGAKGGKKVGPAQINRRLVAEAGKVYAPLGDQAPISVIDAATGKVLRVLSATVKAEEFLVSEGILIALVNDSDTVDFWRRLQRDMRIVAIDPETGELLWEQAVSTMLPMTLASDGRQVVYHNGKVIRSLEIRDGSLRWTSSPTGQKITLKDSWSPDSPGAQKANIILAPQFAPTLLIYEDVVAFAGGRQLNVVSAKDGRELWRTPYAATNYSVPVDLFGFDSALWGPDTSMNLWRPVDDDISFLAYDPLTGNVTRNVSGKYDFPFQHHRCHQMKVVGSTVIAGRAGIEFLDTKTGDVTPHHWVRGSCYFGVMPANGLLYVPPHNCACYVRAKLSGFMALSAQSSSASSPSIPKNQRMRRGPAYGQVKTQSTKSNSDDWPTYRHDVARSGRTSALIDSNLVSGWQSQLGGNLTSPVIAGGRVFVASTDEHILYVLNAKTGKRLWQHSFNARVDSPPTVYDGLVVTGCRDGSVTALRAADGLLAWRFMAMAIPEQRMIVSRGQLESIWPIHGSVLAIDNIIYFAAGKSSYLDGGLRFYGLSPHTGKKLIEKVIQTRQSDGSQTLDDQYVDGLLNDILSSNGELIFMRHQILNKEGRPQRGRVSHLHSPDGYLSSDTTSRLIWTYSPLYTSPHQGAFYDLRLSRVLFPSGRILVEDDETIYGFGQNYYAKLSNDPGGTFALFACPKNSNVPLDKTSKEYRRIALDGKHHVHFKWWKEIPIQAWAMVKTQDVLFVAGPRARASVSQNALNGMAPGLLLAVSPTDGTILTKIDLSSMPVWDGMACAEGNVYISLADGNALCLRSLTDNQ